MRLDFGRALVLGNPMALGLVRGVGRGLARLLLFFHYRVLSPLGDKFAVWGMALLARTSTVEEWNATLNGYLSKYGLVASLGGGGISVVAPALTPADSELETFLRSLGENNVKH